MDSKDFAKQLGNLAALDDPVRRKLYLYVVGRGEDVGRDEAAKGTGISRALAAFHLDRLVEADLLQASFRRPEGRGGPGAGRPAKLYRRSTTQLDVTLPRRRYELAAHIFAKALVRARSEASLGALRDAAREWGKRLAGEVGHGRGQSLARVSRALEACGFEPADVDGEVVLRNCPFDSVRSESKELVCGMNLSLVEGLLEGLEVEDVHARLAPRPEMCCVALRSSGAE
jgi:predicted ArsR family transcriptional regulator